MFVALLLFNLVLVLMQLWLFASVLEGIMRGEATMALPAALVSAVLFCANLWMVRGVARESKRHNGP